MVGVRNAAPPRVPLGRGNVVWMEDRWLHHRLPSEAPQGRRLDHGNKGSDQGEWAAVGFSIDEKIGVGGDDRCGVMQFRETGDAGIREVHGGISVFFHEFPDSWDFRSNGNRQEVALFDQFQNGCAGDSNTGHEVTGLGQDGLRNIDAGWQAIHDFSRPKMVGVAFREPGNQWSCVHDVAGHRPMPSRCFLLVERSVYSPRLSTCNSRRASPSVRVVFASVFSSDSRMVRKPRALVGRVSVPQGRTMPFSSSTSTVIRLMGSQYQNSRPRQAGFLRWVGRYGGGYGGRAMVPARWFYHRLPSDAPPGQKCDQLIHGSVI